MSLAGCSRRHRLPSIDCSQRQLCAITVSYKSEVERWSVYCVLVPLLRVTSLCPYWQCCCSAAARGRLRLSASFRCSV